MAVLEPKYETMPRKELEQLQLERLQAVLHRCYKNVPFFRHKLDEAGIDPEDIRRLQDVQRLPFTCVEELHGHYPYGLFAAPLREVVRLHASSGTTGQPKVTGYTANDLKDWSRLVARGLTAAGVTNDDVIQISFGYGILTSAFGFHYGAERLGASVIPMSQADIGQQLQIMKDFRTTVIACTPSYAMFIARKMLQLDYNPNALQLKRGVFFGEPWSDEFRTRIETELKIQATDHYGISELMGPGISYECSERNGLHIAEDHFLPEVVDPKTGNQLEPGKTGELVLTTLTKEATPIIRFRTGDITSIDASPCKCGRTLLRMRKVAGRTDDMLKIQGVDVFPSRVGEIITKTLGQPVRFKLLTEEIQGLPHLKVILEISDSLFVDTIKGIENELKSMETAMESELGITPRVQILEHQSFEELNSKTGK